MASHGEQDLLPDQTEGFKVGEKKTLDEYKNMGKHRSFLTLRL
jgi:Rho GDP-dissociation inhibitor